MLATCLSIAAVARGASISGTVTALGAGVGGISVDVFLWDNINSSGEMVGFAMTGADGSYTVSNLAAGNYRLGFRDNSGVYAPVFYSSSLDIGSATSVVVTAAQAASGIDAALVAASSIGGTITAPGGATPLDAISIALFRLSGTEWTFVGGGTTQADGTYFIGGLAAGTYRLQFDDPSGIYAGEFYNDKPSLALADNVNVPASTAVGNISASLAAGSSISGTITGPGGAPLLGPISISAYAYDSLQAAWIPVAFGETDQSGFYSVGGLSAGIYRVGFTDFYRNYSAEFYNNAADVDSATDVVVAISSTTSGIDASLSFAGYDSWAVDYGLDPATTGALSADPDNDGFANRLEYAFGTDPNMSTPALLAPTRTTTDLVVTYSAKLAGVTYVAQTTADLNSGTWNDVAALPTDAPDQTGVQPGYSRKILSIPSAGKLFFRLKASWN